MENDLETKRKHSASHIMTAAVQMIYGKEVGLGVGPWTDSGFYQDFDFSDMQISESDLKTIEKKMRWIVNKDMPIKREVVSAEQALELCKGDTYKTELVEEVIEKGEDISFYYIGESLDKAISVNLCAGPHLESTGELGVFKLERVAGAYWRGDEKNKMLTRIYGVAFATSEELAEYQERMEEAKKRDHRKLGKELGLFTFSDLVGSGLPLYTPEGNTVLNEIANYSRELNSRLEYGEVHTPNINKAELFKTSGHYDQYKDDMLSVTSHYVKDEMFLKPMNCPQHTQIYASQPRSYKDLPIRYSDFANLYRDERPGELSGLTRLRAFRQDDGHSFCREDQIEEEISNILDTIKEALKTYKLDYVMRLSLRDQDNKEKYLGTDEVWEKSQDILRKLLISKDITFTEEEGEAAFYGPKIDIVAVDALGREWQISTAQLDFSMPSRFKLEYTNENGEKETPVMIHRALVGSPERFFAILIEHFAGAFPLWLSPEQVRVLPIAETHKEYARKIADELRASGFRVELDDSNDTLGKRIRNVKTAKVPYFLVLGDDEVANKTVTIESRDSSKQAKSLDEFIQALQEEISNKS